MKKYLFGLGAMLVGAGLMFVLMHGEVSADSKEVPEKFVCSGITTFEIFEDTKKLDIVHCKAKKLDCAYGSLEGNVSCVKRGIF